MYKATASRGIVRSIQLIGVVSCNVATRRRLLEELREMDADVALLQEVSPGAAVRLPAGLETGGRGHWDSHMWTSDYPEDRFRTWCDRWPMVVKLSDQVEVERYNQIGPDDRLSAHEITVSDVGLMTAARVTPKDPEDGEPFIAVQCTRTGTRRIPRSGLLSA